MKRIDYLSELQRLLAYKNKDCDTMEQLEILGQIYLADYLAKRGIKNNIPVDPATVPKLKDQFVYIMLDQVQKN